METQTITPEAPVHVDTLINVTEAAAGKIRELLSEEGKAESGLRVFVQGGGCSGFQYGLMIEESFIVLGVRRGRSRSWPPARPFRISIVSGLPAPSVPASAI